MHPTQVEEIMKTFVVLVDTREQKWVHIKSALDATETSYKAQKLNYGDYSCEVTDSQGNVISLADKLAIERKASLDELAGNFTKGRARFDREFKRAIADNAKLFLLIEKSSWEDLINHKYRSMFPPKSYMATLFSWQAKYNITVNFCNTATAGKLIKGILYYAMKNYLLSYGGDEDA